ncbi:GtrA family protein [Patescibacteria group bacterium]|nr:GtrA family protein [Patescibacteria group bacterium]MBU1448501.1 GtrA family protein [Patescibacteria group bacterium]MBU2613217.1 GtrA family protein [Patescibacteria group bacterium]
MASVVSRAIETLHREWYSVFKFLVVGGTTVGMKLGLYALLSRVFWTGGPRWVENILALSVATIFNYLFHRHWTFSHLAAAPGSTARYLIVLVFGNALDASLFYVGHEIFRLYDFFLIIGISAIIPFFTFVIHRVFTFHPDPYRRKPDVVQSA